VTHRTYQISNKQPFLELWHCGCS